MAVTRFHILLLASVVLTVASLGCSVGEALVGRSGAVVPTATKTPRPTFTPLPGVLTPVAISGQTIRGALPPGVTVAPNVSPTPVKPAAGQAFTGTTKLVLIATETSIPSPTPEATATEGPTGTPTPDIESNRPTRGAGPRPLPTPYALVNADKVNGRRGPGGTFELIGQAQKGAELMILGRTPDSDWWQVCCIANQPVWVLAELVTAKGPLEEVPVFTPAPTPVPTPVPLPTQTPLPTGTPLPPWDIARGPEFFQERDDGILNIFIKVYEGTDPYEKAVPGYFLKVIRDGKDVSTQVLSHGDDFDQIYDGSGKTVIYEFNDKFEMRDAGETDWEMYLATPGGRRVSEVTRFTTTGDSYRNLDVYIAYKHVR